MTTIETRLALCEYYIAPTISSLANGERKSYRNLSVFEEIGCLPGLFLVSYFLIIVNVCFLV